MSLRLYQNQHRRKRGVALLLVLFAVVISAILALSFLSAQSTSLGIARNIQNYSPARYVAESGMELAVAYVRSDTAWRTNRSHGTWVTNESFATGTFTIVGEDGEDTDGNGTVDGDGNLADDNTDLLTLTVTGTVNGAVNSASHIVRVVMAPGGGVAAPHFAVSDKVEVKNDGIIDSYDSTAGPYGGANVSSTAYIATNSTGKDKIKVKNDGIIKGNVKVGVGGDTNTVIKLEANGTITGSSAVLDVYVVIASVSEPSGMASSQGDVTITSGTTTWSSDQHFDKLEVKDTAIIEISGDVTVLCEEDFKFKDTAQLQILPGATLTLYGKKNVKFEGQTQGNANTADPSVFDIYLLDNDKVEVKGSAALHATVIAPDVELKVKDTAQFFGAFHGKKVKVEDTGQLHADLSSALAVGGGGYSYQAAWIEQP